MDIIKHSYFEEFIRTDFYKNDYFFTDWLEFKWLTVWILNMLFGIRLLNVHVYFN